MRASIWVHAVVLAMATVASAQSAPDAISTALFAPELVMQNQQAIGLSEAQTTALRDELRQAQTEFTDLQWKLQYEAEQMAKLVGPASINEQQALRQLDKVLDAERQVKRRQIVLLVRIKNLLTVEQQDQLRAIRSGGTP